MEEKSATEFHIEIVTVENVRKHENADTLSICSILGYTVIFRTGQFQEGDKAVYIPTDSVVPVHPRFSFITDASGRPQRIKAKKLRGVFSMGILIENEGWDENTDLAETLGIVKYESPEDRHFNGLSTKSQSSYQPSCFHVQYGLEALRRVRNAFDENEEVVITEKIHGMNGRAVYTKDEFFVGSHRRWVKSSIWNTVAEEHNLANKLQNMKDHVFYFEVYGQVQRLQYGVEGATMAVFDILDSKTGEYLSFDKMVEVCKELNIPIVNVLYRGPFAKELPDQYADGKSTYADHTREGCVIASTGEKRKKFKHVGQEYLLKIA